VTPWDINTEAKVQKVIKDAIEWGITDLLVEVRYRADTFYKPNKNFNDFYNPETTSYLLKDNPNLDVLQCFIENTKGKGINIHAWVTVNVVTTGNINLLQKNHIYYTNPEWLTVNSSGQTIKPSQFEGAYLDHGVEEVKNYLINIFSDIVQNYDLYGLHIDYIRYPSSEFGHNPISIQRYYENMNERNRITFEEWKEYQTYELVKRIGLKIKEIKPSIYFSAAVIPSIDVARSRYSQNWYKWLDDGIIDYIYIMAYQTSNTEYLRIISNIPYHYRKNIIVGIRAWSEKGNYALKSIREKISMTPDHYVGFSFFSYGGVVSRNYQVALKEYKPRKVEGFVFSFENYPLPGAKITHRHDSNLYTFSDNNGYFYININNIKNNDFICSFMNFSQTKTYENNKQLFFNLPIFTTDTFQFSGIETDEGFFLWWDKAQASLYRKTLPGENDYILLGNFDTSINFFYDTNQEQAPVYEYKLLHGNNLQSFVYKTHPNAVINFVKIDVVYENQKILLKLSNDTKDKCKWVLMDLSSNILLKGDLNPSNEDLEIPDYLLKSRFLIFKYKLYDKETTILVDFLSIKEKYYEN